jgi:hypothetical protein
MQHAERQQTVQQRVIVQRARVMNEFDWTNF